MHLSFCKVLIDLSHSHIEESTDSIAIGMAGEADAGTEGSRVLAEDAGRLFGGSSIEPTGNLGALGLASAGSEEDPKQKSKGKDKAKGKTTEGKGQGKSRGNKFMIPQPPATFHMEIFCCLN